VQPLETGRVWIQHFAYTSIGIQPKYNTGQAAYRISQNEPFGDKPMIMSMGRVSPIHIIVILIIALEDRLFFNLTG
jgi:hypothetical protein